MRLIDADVLMPNAEYKGRYDVVTAYDIANAPTVEPEPRKKGKWIYCEDSTADCVEGYRCNKCGFFIPWDYLHKSIDYIKDYNYCPNCGEPMKKR